MKPTFWRLHYQPCNEFGRCHCI